MLLTSGVFAGGDVAIETTVIVIIPNILVLYFFTIAMLPSATTVTIHTFVTGTFEFTTTRKHYTLFRRRC